MRLRDLFGGSARHRDGPAVERIRAAAMKQLAPREGSAVTVSEILCLDPACPDLETVILVMSAGQKSRAYKVAKPLCAVTDEDVACALAPERMQA